MNKAIFLDRDGVIINNDKHYYIYKPKDIEYVADIFDAVAQFSKNGYLLFIVTNQGGISKGEYTIADAEAVNNHIVTAFKSSNIKISDIQICPHHNSIEQCLCRKPNSLMIEKLIAKHNIDISKSIMIGDSERDVVAGEKAGLKSILIKANESMLELAKSLVK